MDTQIRTLATLAVVVCLLTGCGAAAVSPSPTAAPSPTTMPATQPPPDPTASPTAAPPVGPKDPAYLTGHADGGSTTSEGTSTTNGDLSTVKGVVLDGVSVTLSDARATGSCTMHVNAVGSETSRVGFQWGTMRIANADGAWEGSWTGAYWDGLQSETDAAAFLVGSGAYQGLTLYLSFQGHASRPADLAGVILPVAPPTS